MNARVLLLRIAAALTGLLLCCSLSNADDFKDFAELDIEELLNTEVYSASKREQKISEAPNAVYVITADDIKGSGAVNLPDLLRMVPGVDVANAYGNTFGVSARGFNERLARRMLALSAPVTRIMGWLRRWKSPLTDRHRWSIAGIAETGTRRRNNL